MIEHRQRSRASRLRRMLATGAHALDVLPDGLATGLGLALGVATAVAAARGGWLWGGLVVVGLAFVIGRNVGARPRREGLMLPGVGTAMLAGLTVVLVGIAWRGGRDESGGPWVVVDEEEDFLREDLGGAEIGEGASSSGSGDDSRSGSDGTTQLSGSTGDADSTSGADEGTESGAPEQSPCSNGVFIEGGSFDGHVIDDLCMDETEVTVAQYQRCVDEGSCTEADTGLYCNAGKEGRERHPINCVDWAQADTFCRAYEGKLPTEWEWEWAARGRDEGRTYPWGNTPEPSCDRVVMSGEGNDGCGKDRTWPVGSKPKGDSRDGLEDMAGNVWEWTASEREEGGVRIVRGGSWCFDLPFFFRASLRVSYHPAYRDSGVGFRCARTSAGSQ